MRLILLLLLAAAPCYADIVYSPTAGSGYKPLDGATIRGKVSVRAQGMTPPVRFVLGGFTWTENSCPCDLMGDPNLWDSATVPDGSQLLTVNGIAVKFTVDNVPDAPPAPPAPTITGPAHLKWDAVTTNEDGSAASIAGYTVKWGASPDALGFSKTVTGTTADLVDLAPGTYHAGVLAFDTDGSQSALSKLVSFVIAAPPPPPVDVCKTDPLTLTVRSWPGADSGSRTVGYLTNKPITRLELTWPLRVRVVDKRGCEAVVVR